MTPAEERRLDRTMNIVGLIAALALVAPIYLTVDMLGGGGALAAAISLVVFPATWGAVVMMACNFLLRRHYRRQRRDEVQP